MAFAGEIKGGPADPIDFTGGIHLSVDGALLAIADVLNAAGCAEIYAAGEFADNQQVEPGHQLGFEAGGFGQGREYGRRSQVGEQI